MPYNRIKHSLICLKQKNKAAESTRQSLSYWTVEHGILSEYLQESVIFHSCLCKWGSTALGCTKLWTLCLFPAFQGTRHPCRLQLAQHFNLCSGSHTSATPLLSSNIGLSTKSFWWHSFSTKECFKHGRKHSPWGKLLGSTLESVPYRLVFTSNWRSDCDGRWKMDLLSQVSILVNYV